MRIGLSTTTLEPSLNKGHLDGIGVYTNHLLNGFLARGYHVEGRSFPKFLKSRTAYPLVTGKPFFGSFISLASMALLTGGRFRTDPHVDIFHVTDYRVVPMQCPVVASLHDAIPMKYPHLASSRFRTVKNYIQRSVAQYADRVITLSHYTIPDIVEYYGIPESRISVVPCGVDSSWLTPASEKEVESALGKRGLVPGYFLFVGTIQPRKNIERILDAYTRLAESVRRERKLVIVGRAGWRCDALVARLGELIQAGQVVWLNDVQTEVELRHLYAGAGVFVFPSIFEGFGIPILEAFASGVPVVTSNTTSLPEVSGGAAIEINPESVDDILSAMELLAVDDGERRKRIEAGRKRVASFTWAATVEKTLDVYRQLL
jgi:alpha-1,3-rhamnosyl/mannosyltransferase